MRPQLRPRKGVALPPRGNQPGTGARSNGAPASTPSASEARARARSLAEAEALLRRPFVAGAIEFLCLGSYPKQNPTTALVAPYLRRQAVEKRLDHVVGAENWTVSYREAAGTGEGAVLCTLAVFGTPKQSYGQGSTRWAQEANAFKRAARCFGIGRYLAEMQVAHVAIGTAAHEVRRSGRTLEVPGALAKRLRSGYEARIRSTYVAHYGAPLDHHDEPASAGDEGEVASGTVSEASEETEAPAGAGMQAISGGPSEGGEPGASPEAREALRGTVSDGGYQPDTVAALAELLFAERQVERLSEAQVRDLRTMVEAARVGGIAQRTLAGQLTKALGSEDRPAARAKLGAWVLGRGTTAESVIAEAKERRAP